MSLTQKHRSGLSDIAIETGEMRATLKLFLFLITIQTLFVQSANAELEVESKPKWGFDGTVQVEDFNLLSVEVFNNSENPWQGAVWVEPVVGIQTVDLPVVQPDLFIEPYGKRQLQFYIFLPDRTEYKLSWGLIDRGRFRAEDDYKIDSPKVNHRKIVVQLTNPDLTLRSPNLPSFDEENFPASSTVLHPLKGLVLDHVPRWQNPQTQAFRDWLYGGGILYLVTSESSDLMDFPANLSELNEPSDVFPVGYGKVIRTTESIKPDRTEANQQNNYKNLSSSGTIFTLLKEMTTPDHNWKLIYFLAVIYLLILFPGCWLIGRKKGDFRLTYTVVLATVALFSFGFHSIGKRGYGEKTTVNSVAFLKPGQPGRWLVKQWSNFFITTGNIYGITHNVDASATSSGQHSEGVRGMAFNQPTGVMQTDIPSFSNRTVLHTGVLKSEGFRPELSHVEHSDGLLKRLELTLPEGKTWPKVGSKVALYRDKLYHLNFEGNKLRLTGNGIEPSQLNYSSLQYNRYRFRNEAERPSIDLFEKTFWLMISDDLGLFNDQKINANSALEDTVKVYLMTEMPSDFFATGEEFPQQNGHVLYSFDFHLDRNE